MDKKIIKVPSIRFDKFTEDWQQCKLDSIFGKIRNAFVGTATPYYVENGHFYLESNNVKNGQINRNTEVFINDEFHEKQKDKWLHTGDLVMVQSGHVGHTAVIPEELDGIAAHALIMFSDYKEKSSPYFLNYQFQTRKSKKQLGFITTGNTIKHILSSEMKKFEVKLPSYYEQTKIGDFFELLEEIITLQQQFLNDHKQLKKAMLQKMFPQKGEIVPRVRVAGFTDNWKQDKLGAISETYSGGTPSATNKSYYNGIIPFIRSGEVNSANTELFLTEEGLQNSSAKLVDIGDILYALYGATSGKVGISKIKGAINQAILAIKPIEGYDSYFIMQWLKKQENIIVKTYLQGGQGNLSGSIVKDLKMPIPNTYEEQIQIGNLFKQLDKTIDLHQKKLETYQELKKAMLQKMFV